MRTSVSFILALVLAIPAAASVQNANSLARWDAGTWTVWRIDRPAPGDSAAVAYPAIVFRKGDMVVIEAGGCVRDGTGVFPLLLTARVSIPGATAGLAPLAGLLRQELRVLSTLDEESTLRLLVPAADGGDASGVCQGQSDAYVIVAIEHGDAPMSPAPMDLVTGGSSDANGIWMNPMWGSQYNKPGTLADPQFCFTLPGYFSNPGCTTQATNIDNPSGFNELICSIGATTPIHGHVNWKAGDYKGPIAWDSQAFFDRDYNMVIPPPGKNGLTVYNTTTIKGEFDARETTDNFASPWWKSFHDGSDSTKTTMVNGKAAIMVGLVGVDCEHDCHSEVHPVWGLAIHVKDDPNDDVWAVFARNWGNEGYCSSYQHLVAFAYNRLIFTLPWRAGATSVGKGAGTVFYANKTGMSYWWGAAAGQKVTLTMQLLSPYSYGRVHGELHLKWSGPAAAPAAPAIVTIAEAESDTGEHALEALASSLDPEKRAELDRAFSISAKPDQIALTEKPSRLEEPTDLSQALVTTIPDPAAAARNESAVMAFREAVGHPLPGPVGEIIERAYQKRQQP